MHGIGKPQHFDVEHYLTSVSMMIDADEVERAFWMLENLPGYYRDYPPERAVKMKERLHRQLFTPVQYKGIYKEVMIDEQHTKEHWPTRAALVEGLVMNLNKVNIVPNIMELAPGSEWLAWGLRHHGMKFTYERLSLDDDSHQFDKALGPTFNIFCAFEIIEHLYNEFEIYQNYLKFDKKADIVLISTPLYTYAGGMPDWETRALGHLRTYTPKELEDKAREMFPGYVWLTQSDYVIHVMGKKA